MPAECVDTDQSPYKIAGLRNLFSGFEIVIIAQVIELDLLSVGQLLPEPMLKSADKKGVKINTISLQPRRGHRLVALTKI